MTCPIWWLTECAVAQAELPIAPTGNATIDKYIALATGVGGVVMTLGAMFGVNKWRERRAEREESDPVLLAEVAAKQEAMAEVQERTTRHLERVDEHLRDARERLAKLEGRAAI